MKMPTHIGKHFMLFREPHKMAIHDLVISSHGHYHDSRKYEKTSMAIRFGRMTMLPSYVSLFFYGPHDMLLQDPKLLNLMLGKVKPLEVATPLALVNDYVLSRFQSDERGADESFSSIMQDIAMNRTFSEMKDGLKKTPDESIRSLIQLNCGAEMKRYDVLTVKKPDRFSRQAKLSDLLTLLKCGVLNYPRIHCLFCRGPDNRRVEAYDTSNN